MRTQLRTQCPSCSAPLRLSDPALAGKVVKCPRCGKPMRLPAPAEPLFDPSDDEGASEETTLSRRRSKRAGRAKGKSGNSAKLWIFGGLGAVVVVIGVVGLLAAFGAFRPSPPPAAAGPGPVAKTTQPTPARKEPVPPAPNTTPLAPAPGGQRPQPGGTPATPPPAPQAAWVTYTDPAKVFQAKFPAQPKVKHIEKDTYVDYLSRDATFGVGYADLDAETLKEAPNEEFFEVFAAVGPQDASSKQAVKVNGRYPGFEWVLKDQRMDDGAPAKAWQRAVLVGKRFFTLHVYMRQGKEDDQAARTFLDSFQVLTPPGG